MTAKSFIPWFYCCLGTKKWHIRKIISGSSAQPRTTNSSWTWAPCSFRWSTGRRPSSGGPCGSKWPWDLGATLGNPFNRYYTTDSVLWTSSSKPYSAHGWGRCSIDTDTDTKSRHLHNMSCWVILIPGAICPTDDVPKELFGVNSQAIWK